MAKSRYAAAVEGEGETLAEKIMSERERLGSWVFLYEGITVPLGFIEPTPPPPSI